MFWTCFLIQVVPDYTWDTPWDTLHQIFMRVTRDTKDSMCFILRVMTRLGFPRNSMRYRQVSIRRRPPRIISKRTGGNSTRSDSPMIGVEKFEPLIRITIAGPNGYSYSFLNPTTVMMQTRQDPFQSCWMFSKRKGITESMRHATKTCQISVLHNGTVGQPSSKKRFWPNTGLRIFRKRRSIGARNSARFWPMMKSSMESPKEGDSL